MHTPMFKLMLAGSVEGGLGKIWKRSKLSRLGRVSRKLVVYQAGDGRVCAQASLEAHHHVHELLQFAWLVGKYIPHLDEEKLGLALEPGFSEVDI